jgi:hypothetical protein
MNWLRLVAELRGAKPEEVATEFLRLLQNIWMDGYQYGSITTTETYNKTTGTIISIVVSEDGTVQQIKTDKIGEKVLDLGSTQIYIQGDQIEKTEEKPITTKTLTIRGPPGQPYTVIKLDEHKILTKRKFPNSGKTRIAPPKTTGNARILYGKKGTYILLLAP